MITKCSSLKVFAGAIALAAAIVGTAFVAGSSSASAQNTKPGTPGAPGTKEPVHRETTKEKSLFERLGGTYPIAAIVDDYVNRLPSDKVIMANPQVKAAIDKAAAGNGLPGLKYQITSFTIEATGGSDRYKGRSMKEAHKTLKINESEWEAGVAVLKITLDKFKVPAAEQDELIKVLGKTHDDIVTNPPAEKGEKNKTKGTNQ